MKTSRISQVLLVFVVSIFSSLAAFGQGTGGTIQGRVTDANGSAIPSASVSIEGVSGSTAFRRSVETDADGRYHFAEVPPGPYRFDSQARNFNRTQTDFVVAIDEIVVGDVTLEVGTAQSVVVITRVDNAVGQTPETRSALDARRSDELPRRPTISSLFKIAPFVRPEPLAGGFQFGGASGADNTFFIDGQEVTNFRTGTLNRGADLPFEVVQEVQLRDNPVDAEYAGSLGGSVSVATRGGAARWTGNAGVSFAPAKLQGKANVVLNRFGTSAGQYEFFRPRRDDSTAWFPTASAGEPIVKDKLWFFGSYSPQIYKLKRTVDYYSSSNPSTRVGTESIAYESDVRTEAMFARLDAQPFESLRLTGSFLYNPTIQDGALPSASEGLGGAPQAFGTLRGAAFLATRGGRENSNLFNSQATWTPTRSLVVNVRAGRGFLNEKLDSYGIPRATRFLCSASGSPSSVPGSGCSGGFTNFANNFVRDFDVSKRTTFDADGAFYGVNLLGSHNIKFGYQYNNVFNDLSEGYVDTGVVTLFYGIGIDTLTGFISPTPGNLGSGFLQRFGTVATETGRTRAFFAQDQWTIANRVTVSAGVRFEDEDVAAYRAADEVRFGWKDKIAPRLSASYDVFGDGKTKFFGSWGRFFDRQKFDVFRANFGSTFFRDYFEILPSRGAAYSNYTFARVLGTNPYFPNGQCPITSPTGWSVCQLSFTIPTNILPAVINPIPNVDPNLKPARTSALTVGGEQRVSDWFVLGARYTRQRLDRAVEDIGTFNDQGSQVYFPGNPGEGFACQAVARTNFPCAKARRDYDAFEVVADKRGGDYFFNLSYTFSRLTGNYSGLASSDELGRVAPNGTRAFDDPQSPLTASGRPNNGRLATDRPHVFKAFGGYAKRWSSSNATTVSAFTTLQSGTPLTTVYQLYLNTSAILNGRGDLGRTEKFAETDLMLAHRWKFATDDRFTLEPYFIVLNLFDRRGELGRQTSISATNFTSTAITSGGCTTCGSQIAVYTTLAGTGIRQFVQNVLNTRGVSSTGIRNDYNLSNLFQSPRSVRLGVRLWF